MLRDSLASFQYSFGDLKGMKILITGDIGVEKTALLRRFLGEAQEETREKITIIDFASLDFETDEVTYGGHLTDAQAPNIRIIRDEQKKEEIFNFMHDPDLNYNHKITKSLLEQYVRAPTKILFLNEVSVHLLRGTLQKLWDSIKKAETVLVSGYMSSRAVEDFGTGISKRENLLMRRLSAKMDRTIRL